MDGQITRAEHEEFRRTVEARMSSLHDEDVRLSKRLTDVENDNAQINALTVSVQKLADSIEHMRQMQEDVGKRLSKIESRDGEMWRKVVGYIVTAVIGIVIGFIFNQFGM